jgi:hypothetical protein
MLLTIRGGIIIDRRRVEPEDNCDIESYEPVWRRAAALARSSELLRKPHIAAPARANCRANTRRATFSAGAVVHDKRRVNTTAQIASPRQR